MYDAQNRLVNVSRYNEVNQKEVLISFQYDGLGRRTSKKVANVLYEYIYSGNDVIEETQSNINPTNNTKVKKETREYTYGPRGTDDIIHTKFSTYERIKKLDQIKTTGDYYYEKNHEGSIIRITSSTGATIDEYSYTVFGKAYRKNLNGLYKPVAGANDSPIGNTRLYTGREYDREISLYYLRARYYDSQMGRFISRDPIGMRDNVDLYTYVANSPINYVDRMGLEKILIMYSPNHWYDRFSTETFSKVLEKYAIETTKGRKVDIVLTSIDDFDDFKNNLKIFNAKSDYANGKIIYIGHNQGWLSSNVTDSRIGELSSLTGNVSMDLFSCATQIDSSTNYVSWSDQIAQKLANQLNIPVSGSSQPVAIVNNSTQYSTPDSAWKTSLPGGAIQDESFSIENVLHSIISNF